MVKLNEIGFGGYSFVGEIVDVALLLLGVE